MTDTPLYDFNEHDVWTLFHSFCFDFSVWEIFGALLFGGRLVIVPKDITRDAVAYEKLLIDQQVTVLNSTPSAFYVLQHQLTDAQKPISIRYIIFGGEALDLSRVAPWKRAYPQTTLVNMYGITETTVHVSFQPIEDHHLQHSNSLIGRPIPTLRVYILDPNGQIAPIGVPGEMFVGGDGLARGYLNRPELTAERFLPDPFTCEGRLYRTGDRARWLPDGNIEYLGRIDHQVKIRGFRIEPGEIEAALLQSGLVRQCVVLARPDTLGNLRLIAYVVSNGTFEREGLTAYLRKRLPDYMVPALWVALDSLPLTANGKLDTKALPDPDASTLLTDSYEPPRNELETALASLWQDLLGIDRIGIHDNFFYPRRSFSAGHAGRHYVSPLNTLEAWSF